MTIPVDLSAAALAETVERERYSGSSAGMTWRDVNTVTDWEFAEVGRLLVDYEPRDLALRIVRLEGQLKLALERINRIAWEGLG